MLTLTRKTDYALIALCHMANEPNGCSSAREIASRYNMPLPLLMNILKLLTQKGLAKSSRGPRGGYSLALAADKITLNDVIRAVEGPIQLVHCLDRREEPEGNSDTECGCELVSCCPVRSPIHRIHDRLAEFLDGVSLADLALDTAPCCKDEDSQGEYVQLSGPR